ncbi:ECF transporter S component [Mycoplasmoides genitalium]|uniref:Uncharacterized protein MG313 n=1 Tax=Mycoplasma genitalium (strain ATCC 33530 / DSM 19775 / NCTC 10195 / G37) TaxID=243273 RepID=Y313_MYCGE|nr:ECF transporter S component [Mycoplasmoides genitalium]Q49414.3 RecName: Full=Uncharacterized protein MG313 [Mycoplasmoides genitalium G37]AAC71535.1 membrane protein, putative [Mycoplasmoides genitalium G37]ABY79497.1 membrane protein, putative [synthetic Mycoplasma genitalium JCVI-1.0]
MFPYYPLRLLKSLQLLVWASVLLALTFIFSIFSISVTNVLSISFLRIPFALFGWIFGPIWGFIFGFLSDTIDWLTKGYVWFWMFALQKPLFAFLAGIVKGIYLVRKNASNYKVDFWVLQTLLVTFFVVSVTLLLLYLTNNEFQQIGTKNFQTADLSVNVVVLQIITLVSFVIFFLVTEGFLGFVYVKKRNKEQALLTIYSLVLMVLMSVVVSILLGTIAAIEFITFINNGRPSNNFVLYGVYFFLLPRVLVQALLLPIYVALFYPLIGIVENNLKNYLLLFTLSWKS